MKPLSQMRVLVADDEAAIREVLRLRLKNWGYRVRVAADGLEAEKKVKSFRPHLVISDVVMPGLTGFELLQSLRAGDPERPVILMTAYGSIDMAVAAIKGGACDFVTKPLDYSELESALRSALQDVQHRMGSRKRVSGLRKKGARFGEFVGAAKSMRRVYRLIESVAATDASILITGESGTGKELAARTIHEMSQRSRGPFVAINTAAIPKELMESEIFGHEKGAFTGAFEARRGCFEQADGGTLFLDEIAEMPMALQPKLLRVLEDGRLRRVGGRDELHFDLRLLVATNRDPHTAVKEGRLRTDLYYRIGVFTIHLPPLRERTKDIPILAQHFLELFSREHGTPIRGLQEEASNLLKSYSWPGNVRELKNVMQRAVVLARGDWIGPAHLPEELRKRGSGTDDKIVLDAGVTLDEVIRQVILRTLEQTNQNKAEAARRLGLDVKTIRNRLKSYDLL